MKSNPLANAAAQAIEAASRTVPAAAKAVQHTKANPKPAKVAAVAPVARQRAQFLLTGKDKTALMVIRHALENAFGRSISENVAVQVAIRSVEKDAKKLGPALQEVISEDGRRK